MIPLRGACAGVVLGSVVLAGLVGACAPGGPAATSAPPGQPATAAPAKEVAAKAPPVEKAAAPPAAAAKPGGASTASAVAPWQPDQQLLAAARNEKEVVWYSATTQVLVERAAKRFEEITGVKVNATRLSAGPIHDRVLRERQAGLRAVDVIGHGDPGFFLDYKKRNVLERYTPKGLENVRREFKDPDGLFAAQNLAVSMIAYNPQAISAADAPKKWQDVLNPKYRGKLAMADPRHSGVTNELVLHLVKLYDWGFFQKLKENQVQLVRSAHEAVPLLISSERPLAVGALMGSSLPAKRKGSPLEMVFPEEGTLPGVAAVALVRDAPHPSAARLLLDFLYSQEYQALGLTEAYYPVRDDVPVPADLPKLAALKIFVTDFEELARATPMIKERWADLFGG